MKRIVCFLAVFLLLACGCGIYAQDETAITTYTATFSPKQGEGGWYFMKFGSDITELEWNSSGYWGTSPYLASWEVNTGSDGSGVGYKFVAPIKGTVRLRGKAEQKNPDCKNGDGVTASIYKGEERLWSSGIIKYGVAIGEYDVTVSVRKGESLYFRVDPNSNNYFDWTVWFPTVEYTDGVFSGAVENTYFQKKDGVMTELEYNEERDGYVADDGLAFISEYNVMPTDEYSLVKRYIVKEDGRHRIKADMYLNDIRGGGIVLKAYKNGTEIWKQLFTDDETGVMDIRLYAKKDDVIEVEICANNFGGYNYCEWTLSILKYQGTLPCAATVSAGRSSGSYDEIKLGELVGAVSNTNGTEYYSVKNDERFSMIYDGASESWKQDLSSARYTTGLLAYIEKNGYISKNEIVPGQHTQSVLRTTVKKDGILNIDGYFGVKQTSDGVVINIYHNERLIWSSRTGDKRSVRWDEPYDTSYFNYNVDVVADVKSGDKLTFVFDMWRKPNDDEVDISNIYLRYLSGDVISATTEWKLNNSIVIDTKKSRAYIGGIRTDVDSYIKDGTTYISKKDAKLIFGKTAEGEYVSFRNAAELNGKNVVWIADRLAVAYDGIPVMFGYSELSEIETAVKVGELYE